MKIVISILILLLFVSPVSAWWNTDYANRREIQINNTLGSELTYYQVYINLTSNPINSTSLRIINESSETIVPHWQETIVDNNCTELWFNATFLNANSWINETYYIYYENTEVTGDWNGTTTFLQYHGSTTSSYLKSLNLPVTNIIGEWKLKWTNPIALQPSLSNTASNNDDFYNIYYNNAGGLGSNGYASNENTASSTGWDTNIITENTYHKFRIEVGVSGAEYFINNISFGIVSTNLPDENLGLCIRKVNAGESYEQEWSFVRKYAAVEPTAVVGIENSLIIPPTPTNLSYSRGFFWVNHTWDAGTGNVTNFYNVSHNGIWTNDSSNTYYNSGDIGDEGYSEILIYAYNNSGDGTLSDGYITQNISAPPYTPPPTPVNLDYTKGLYWVNHTWGAGSGVDTDSYNVSHNGTWANGSTNTYFNSGGVGRNGISTIIVYAYNGILSEGYITQTVSTQQGIDYERKMSDNDIKSFYYPFMGIFFIFLLLGVVRYIASR